MDSKLVITLDEETTKNYLARAQEITKAHVDADCEPPGVVLTVEIAPPWGVFVSMGNTDLGEATIEFTNESVSSTDPMSST